ncbi:MAG: diguanylate cyclase [Actinobacteria bacterium]|nr:diguanylate cyclase [Actinomycetota bacterium]
MKRRSATNIAVISTGNEGASLITMLSKCQSINIVGLYSSNPESSDTSIARELNIPLLKKKGQLLSAKDIDVIIDTSDGKFAPGDLESIEHVEIIRGKSIDVIEGLAEECKEHIKGIDIVSTTGFELASQKDSQGIYRAIVQGATSIAGSESGSLIIFDERTETCRLAEAIGCPKGLANHSSWELQPGGIIEHLLSRVGSTFIPDINKEPLFNNLVMDEGVISVLASTLREADEVIGILLVGDFKPRLFSDREISLSHAFAVQASLALQKALLLEKNEELTITDNLTGLNNSRHFFSSLDAEIKRAIRYGGYFSILIIDLDNLSYINDCFGLAKGDWAIKKVAGLINTCSRQTDYKARYGGDEFAMILPNTSCQQASVLANRIRRQVNDISVEGNGEKIHLSITIGIAEFPSLGMDCDSLISAANTALTVCKQRGRNLVCCYGDAS